jgi:hypothetical protein
MKARDFVTRFSRTETQSVATICRRWEEEELDDFLGMEIFSGVVIADLLTGDGMQDQVPPSLREAFEALMGEPADSYNEVRQILMNKIELGDESVFGLINKIKGQIGENYFVEACSKAGVHAHLAALGNQEGWDVAVDKGHGVTQYVQVKLYGEANGVLAQIRDVQEKLAASSIVGEHGDVVRTIDFAVPGNIADEVREKAAAAHLHVRILPIDLTAQQAHDIVQEGFNNVGAEALGHFFGQLFAASLTATALQGIVNGFLVYIGAKEADRFWRDTLRGSAASFAGINAALVLEAVLHKASWLGGPSTAALVLVTGIATRAVARRLVSRGDVVEWLQTENAGLGKLIFTLEGAT